MSRFVRSLNCLPSLRLSPNIMETQRGAARLRVAAVTHTMSGEKWLTERFTEGVTL